MCHEVLLGSGEVSPVAVRGVARLDGEADEREHDGPADDDGRLLLGFDRRRRGEVQAKADGDDASDDDVGVLVLLRLAEGGLGKVDEICSEAGGRFASFLFLDLFS